MVAREEPTSFTKNRSVRVRILGVAGSGSQHLQPILVIGLRSVAAGDELVRSPEEDLRWQVPAQFAAQGTLDGDRLKGEFLPARPYVAAASLAGDNEGPLALHGRAAMPRTFKIYGDEAD